jgi:hypothetical protein
MKRGSLTVIAVGVALALGLPTVASYAGPWQMAEAPADDAAAPAAPESGAGPYPGMKGMGMMGHHGPAGDPHQNFVRMCENADAHHAAMLAFAEVRLKLTAAQKPAWTKFAEAAKTAHQAVDKLCVEQKDQPAPVTLPERLARAEQVAAAHLAHIQALRPALDELYQLLSPEQRKTADSLHLGVPGAHGGPGHHGDHGDHGDHHGE